MKSLALFFEVSICKVEDGLEFNPNQLFKALSSIRPGCNTIAKYTAALSTASFQILQRRAEVTWTYKLGLTSDGSGVLVCANLDPCPSSEDAETILQIAEYLYKNGALSPPEQDDLPFMTAEVRTDEEQKGNKQKYIDATTPRIQNVNPALLQKNIDHVVDAYERQACELANCKENHDKSRRFFQADAAKVVIVELDTEMQNLSEKNLTLIPASQHSEELTAPEFLFETIVGFEIGHEIPWARDKRGAGSLHIRRIIDPSQTQLFDSFPPKTESVRIEVPRDIYENENYPPLLKPSNVKRIENGIFDILSLKVKNYGNRYVLDEIPTLLEKK
jgi:hypothetical protein